MQTILAQPLTDTCANTLLLHPHPLLVTEDRIPDTETSHPAPHLRPQTASQASCPWEEDKGHHCREGIGEVPLLRGPVAWMRGEAGEQGQTEDRRHTLTWYCKGSLEAGPLLKGIFGLGIAGAR